MCLARAPTGYRAGTNAESLLSPKSRKAALARVPLLANLPFYREPGGGGGILNRGPVIREWGVKHLLREVIDDGLLANVASLCAVA